MEAIEVSPAISLRRLHPDRSLHVGPPGAVSKPRRYWRWATTARWWSWTTPTWTGSASTGTLVGAYLCAGQQLHRRRARSSPRADPRHRGRGNAQPPRSPRKSCSATHSTRRPRCGALNNADVPAQDRPPRSPTAIAQGAKTLSPASVPPTRTALCVVVAARSARATCQGTPRSWPAPQTCSGRSRRCDRLARGRDHADRRSALRADRRPSTPHTQAPGITSGTADAVLGGVGEHQQVLELLGDPPAVRQRRRQRQRRHRSRRALRRGGPVPQVRTIALSTTSPGAPRAGPADVPAAV